ADGHLLDVDQRAERGVELPDCVGAIRQLGGHGDAHGTPRFAQQFTVVLGHVGPVLVQHRETHHAEPDRHPTDPFDLEKPARGEPGPWAHRIEPHLSRSHRTSFVPGTTVDSPPPERPRPPVSRYAPAPGACGSPATAGLIDLCRREILPTEAK